MSSKASGEPSLLLSVSILHAMRMALVAARAELNGGGRSVPGLDTGTALAAAAASALTPAAAAVPADMPASTAVSAGIWACCNFHIPANLFRL